MHRRRLAFLLTVVVMVLGVALLAWPGDRALSQGVVLVVTSNGDGGDGVCDGSCTLREAIEAANASGGGARVTFRLPSGSLTIRPTRALPLLSSAGTVIDGTTQPGFVGRPVVALEGSGASRASGLVAVVADVEVRGLVVGNFDRYGLAAIGEAAVDSRFVGNWIGLGVDGRSAWPNALGGVALLAGASGTLVGDTCAGCGNRIAGNAAAVGSAQGQTGHGVLIGGTGTLGGRVWGNVIGLDVDGRALPNDDGILVVDGAHAFIGGRVAAARNVVSGNRVAGVELRDTGFLGAVVEGNYVGTDVSGTRAVGNDVGVFVNGTSPGVLIGGAVVSARNVISGNRVGVAVEQRASGVRLHGNLVGLDATGRVAVGNTEDGVSVIAGARDTDVGGEFPGEGNWIGGSGNAVVVGGFGTVDVRVRGNVIGLGLDGESVVGNAMGIVVTDAAAVTIGGALVRAGNVVVGSLGSGVVLDGVERAQVRQNRIGIRLDDVAAGNGVGVVVRGGTLDSQVQENRIGGNVGAGISVLGDLTQRNRLTRNVFLTNGGIGIDLRGDGPTPNGSLATPGLGPNQLMARPSIGSFVHDGFAATIVGVGVPRTRVEVYRISTARPPLALAHPSGFGAGQEFLGTTRVDDDGGWTLRLAIDPETPLTVLTVDSAGNTSEFGRNFFPRAPVLLFEGFTPVGWFAESTEATVAFAPLGARLVAAWRFAAATQTWDSYRADLPFLSTLERLVPGDALWVQLDAGRRVVWEQPPAVVGERAVELRPGLNFATWTGPSQDVEEALMSLGDAVEAVFRWNRGIRRFELVLPRLPFADQAPSLDPGDVVWVRMARPGVWQQAGEDVESMVVVN